MTSPLDYLQITRAVLDASRDSICMRNHVAPADVYAATQRHIIHNSAQWRQSYPNIPYDDPYCRLAYIYMNVPIHASLVERAFEYFPEAVTLLRGERGEHHSLKIVVLGGGPGAELLAIAKILERIHPSSTIHIDFALLDITKQWDDSWHAMKNAVDAHMAASFGTNRGSWPFLVSSSFLPVDLSRGHDLDSFTTRFENTDLCIASYVISELKHNPEALSHAVGYLASRLAPAGLFLVVDRDDRETRDAVANAVRAEATWAQVRSVRGRGRVPLALQRLGEWYLNIESLPRRTWQACFTLASVHGLS